MANQGVLKNLERSDGWAHDKPGCWDCPHWIRANISTGHCDTVRSPFYRALTSYAYRCLEHPHEQKSIAAAAKAVTP